MLACNELVSRHENSFFFRFFMFVLYIASGFPLRLCVKYHFPLKIQSQFFSEQTTAELLRFVEVFDEFGE